MAPLRQQKGNYQSCNFSHLAEAEHLAIGKFTKVNFHLNNFFLGLVHTFKIDNFFIDTTITGFESLKRQKTLSS